MLEYSDETQSQNKTLSFNRNIEYAIKMASILSALFFPLVLTLLVYLMKAKCTHILNWGR